MRIKLFSLILLVFFMNFQAGCNAKSKDMSANNQPKFKKIAKQISELNMNYQKTKCNINGHNPDELKKINNSCEKAVIYCSERVPMPKEEHYEKITEKLKQGFNNKDIQECMNIMSEAIKKMQNITCDTTPDQVKTISTSALELIENRPEECRRLDS